MMMNASPGRWRWALIAAACVMLAACSKRPPEPLVQTASSGLRDIAIARGKVEVEGGLLKLAMPVSGVVSEQAVREGDTVQVGQSLFALRDGVELAQVETAQARLALAQARLRAAQAALPAVQQAAQRYATAARAGAAQPQQADQAQQRLRQARTEVEIAQADVELARAQGKQQKAQLAQFALLAPEAGEIVSLAVRQGSFVQAGEVMATLLPARPLQLRVELNAAYVEQVKVGMKARVVLIPKAVVKRLPCLRPMCCVSARSTVKAVCRTTPSAARCVWSRPCWLLMKRLRLG
ncbi:HlyD family efflux transporter periplasmic adaptor subunit [Alcaligenes faecalis]|uniref:efflux RND transporter periplasmic adaptor subunit n=1 Tax=Alcaligenes faecalis TaxID=511 RepID=UPI00203D54C1|nr:HlyD family efflux transporter periplasmic adaptor subunit [Alcaligenes faecalis]